MRIDDFVRYTKNFWHPHIYIYANDEELKSLSRTYYTCYAHFYDDFKEYPEILEQLHLALEAGVYFIEIRKLDTKKEKAEDGNNEAG